METGNDGKLRFRNWGLDSLNEEDVQGRAQKTGLMQRRGPVVQHLTLRGQISLFVTEFDEPASVSL